MSATLTWHKGGFGTKTGTTSSKLIDDIEALVVSKAGDADFKWEVADSENTTSPLYVSLKRKDASNGRILFVIWTSGPAANNSAILNQAPQADVLYGAYFPNGSTNSAINLTAASGAILGDNTGCTKVAPVYFTSSMYAAGIQPWYFDCEDGVFFGFQDPTATQTFFMMLGALAVDDADAAYACAMGGSSNSIASFGSSSPVMAWQSGAISAGVFSPAHLQVVYPSVSLPYFQAFVLAGGWGAQAGANDVLNDSANSKVYFEPIPLIGQTKGQGIKLKLRQIAHGPGTTAAFTRYDGTGPVPKAWQLNGATAGGNGFPYVVNFKA